MITFDTDGMVAQRFPFPAPIMDYILKNLQPQHLVKLYQCCKFFYAKYRQNIIQRLEIVDVGEQEIFDPTSTIICASNPALDKLIDFWISDTFVYFAPFNYDIIMPSFSHCTIKKLEASNYLIWKEFEALTKAGTIKELKIGEIHDDDGSLVSIDKIIAQVPNATSIEITDIILGSTSFVALATLNHQVKISNFVLNHIDHRDNFNLDLLFEFLCKNADPDCKVHFDFYMDVFMDDEVIDELKRMGIEYTNIITAKLQAIKKELALEESTLMP